MRRLVSIGIFAIVGLASSAALAQAPAAGAPGAPGAAGRPYGLAGCGLGSMVFGNQPGVIQVVAATTNASFFSQTFGITSATSNCWDEPSPMGATAAFVESNREVLAKDISRGQGETIATLSTLAGCEDPERVGRALQSRYRDIFPSSEVTNVEVSGQVISILRRDQSLACAKLQKPAPEQEREELAEK